LLLVIFFKITILLTLEPNYKKISDKTIGGIFLIKISLLHLC